MISKLEFRPIEGFAHKEVRTRPWEQRDLEIQNFWNSKGTTWAAVSRPRRRGRTFEPAGDRPFNQLLQFGLAAASHGFSAEL